MSQQLRVVPNTHLTSALRVAELRLSIYKIDSDFATMLSRPCLVPSPVASMKRGARSGRPAPCCCLVLVEIRQKRWLRRTQGQGSKGATAERECVAHGQKAASFWRISSHFSNPKT